MKGNIQGTYMYYKYGALGMCFTVGIFRVAFPAFCLSPVSIMKEVVLTKRLNEPLSVHSALCTQVGLLFDLPLCKVVPGF